MHVRTHAWSDACMQALQSRGFFRKSEFRTRRNAMLTHFAFTSSVPRTNVYCTFPPRWRARGNQLLPAQRGAGESCLVHTHARQHSGYFRQSAS